MKRVSIHVMALCLALLVGACSKTESSTSTLPHAVVTMRDGTTVAGTVVSSTPTGITLNPDTGGTQNIPMTNVKSIDYGESSKPNVDVASARTFEIPAGTHLSVRTDETIDSATAVKGQSYPGQITHEIRDANGDVLIPSGANARLVVREASKGGRFRGQSTLMVDLQSVSFGGKQYLVHTSDVVERGRKGIGKNKRTGEFVGGGAALGGIIGAIAGGGKGALIGGAAGAGGGAMTQSFTKGKPVRIPAETIMTFRLRQPLRIEEAR